MKDIGQAIKSLDNVACFVVLLGSLVVYGRSFLSLRTMAILIGTSVLFQYGPGKSSNCGLDRTCGFLIRNRWDSTRISRKHSFKGPGGGGKADVGSFENPSYAVTVTDQEAQAARKAFADEAEEKRLKNLKEDQPKLNVQPAADANTPQGGSEHRPRAGGRIESGAEVAEGG